jgi:TetR/AcrR family fatty acid metabolism transcriptional regulator
MRVSKSFVKTKTYDFLKQSVGSVLEIIAEGQKEGVIRADVDIYLLRHLILGILEHMVTRWLLKEGKYDLLEHHEKVSLLLIEGLRPAPLIRAI